MAAIWIHFNFSIIEGIIMKKEVAVDKVVATYYCEDCDCDAHDVPVQESIYNGPPMCPNCEDEMSIDTISVLD